jgi:glucose-1-phosphatase
LRPDVSARYGSVAVVEKIKLVLFDMDNVLCDYDKRARAAFLAGLAGTTTDLVYEAIWKAGFEQLGDSGALDASEYLRGFGERIGYSLSLEEWLTARRHSMKANSTVLNIVGNLRGSVDLAVLTNNTSLVVDHIDVLFPELRPLFGSSIYALAQFKVAKPDPECFRLCLSKLQVAPGTALFVDDLPENVAGAREAGLFAHHYTSAETFRQVLSDYNLSQETI